MFFALKIDVLLGGNHLLKACRPRSRIALR